MSEPTAAVWRAPDFWLLEVDDCPRCGGRHRLFKALRLSRPFAAGWNYWGMCPHAGEPVLFELDPAQLTLASLQDPGLTNG